MFNVRANDVSRAPREIGMDSVVTFGPLPVRRDSSRDWFDFRIGVRHLLSEGFAERPEFDNININWHVFHVMPGAENDHARE